MNHYIGEIAALCTAVFWTITALAFEKASLKIGSLSLNIIRLGIGFIFLSIFNLFYRGALLPLDASSQNWFWLLLSGLVGFLFGDLFLFQSYTIIGSRFAMLIMTLVPPITALTGWIILGEKLSRMNYLGMTLTILGISLAIFNRNTGKKGFSLKFSLKGLLFAFFGAIGQALGLVISKFGMQGYDPFAATQIRIIAGFVGFGILISILGRWKNVFEGFKNRKGMVSAGIGSFFGPFLGVSFSLLAVQYTQTGIASTIMSIVPVLIIPPAIFLFKQKVSVIEIIGAMISVAGVTLFFIH
ncbi:MAG: DMT family transporter [Bacteroidales bacterium]|nr:DMT family transporter [Bacteroidales bacterium]MCB8998454.1 DMT family transporter [Bacteroidales bacterium]MCB9012897.1 DMT family transporter [Bacteroidales bacterium]